MTAEQAQQALLPYVSRVDNIISIGIDMLTAALSEALVLWLRDMPLVPSTQLSITIRGVEQGIHIGALQIACNTRIKFYEFHVQQRALLFDVIAQIDTLDVKIKGANIISELCIRRRTSASVQQLYLKVQADALLDFETIKAKQENDFVLAAPRLRSFWFMDKNSAHLRKLAIVVHSKQFKELGLNGKPSLQIQQLVITHPQLIMNALQEQSLLSVANLELILDGCLSSKINLKEIKGVKQIVLPATEYLTRYKRVLCNLMRSDVQQYLPLDTDWTYMGKVQLQLPNKTKTVTLTSLAYLEHFLHRLTLGEAVQQIYITPPCGAVPFMLQPRVSTPLLLAGDTQEACNLCKQGIAYADYKGVLHREIQVIKGR